MRSIGDNLSTVALPDGERGFRASINFTTDNEWRVDFNALQNTGWQVRSIYVDNSLNTAAAVLTFSASGQRVTIPALSQAYVPVLQNQMEFVSVTSVSTFTIPVFFLERFRQAEIWSVSGAAITVGTSFPDNVDNVAPVATLTFLGVLSRNTVYDDVGNNWDRMRGNILGLFVQGAATPGDAVATPTNAIDTRAFPELFNGSNSDRARNNSAANISRTIQADSLSTIPPGEWTLYNRPSVTVQATATKAAGGAGVRHVLRSFFVSFDNENGSTFNPAFFVIRDGASGVGTILYGGYVAGQASSSQNGALSGLNLFGSPNSAMTIEYTGASLNTTSMAVSASGISVQ